MEIQTQNQIEALHSENMEWLKKLVLYSEDIKEMQSRIEQIAVDNTSKSVMPKIEHFQNQLIIQKHRINSLKHSIKNDEKLLKSEISADNHHATAKDQVLTFEKIISDLKLELELFLENTN